MKKSRIDSFIQRTLAIIVLMAAMFASCIKEEHKGLDPNLPKRTVLVYLAGDNNLTELGQIPELLRAAWTYTGSRCLIYYDAPDTAPVLLSLRGGCQTYPEPFIETVAEYPEENSASAEVFGRVVRDVVRMYPADDYGLVFTSHASGWLPEGALETPQEASATGSSRSIGSDRTPGTMSEDVSEMELADFAAAIPNGQFSFILFEACLMAGVEVAYELRGKTDYILASSAEILSPGFIPIYRRQASRLLFDTSLGVEQALKEFGERYFASMNAQSGAHRSATVSVIGTRKMDELAVLVASILAEAPANFTDTNGLQHFDRPGSYGDRPAAPRYFDFGERMERIASAHRQAELNTLLHGIVVWKAATPIFMDGYNGFAINRHSGLTTYIEQGVFPALNTAYKQTSWYRIIYRE